MKKNKFEHRPFLSSKEELSKSNNEYDKHYQVAFLDQKFMLRDELRPVRLQLELLRPELILQDHHIKETIVIFGSARTPRYEQAQLQLQQAQDALARSPESAACQRALRSAENVLDNSRYLEEATQLAKLVSEDTQHDYYVVTGGGPGVMEAANKGAHLAKKCSVSLGVMLPHEQVPNEYVTPELTFQFHYFAIRKMHFLLRARALIAFPGGFGTLDELFETLTLMQTEKISRMPLLLFNRRFWEKILNVPALVEEGMISAEDISLVEYVETAEEAWAKIQAFYAKVE